MHSAMDFFIVTLNPDPRCVFLCSFTVLQSKSEQTQVRSTLPNAAPYHDSNATGSFNVDIPTRSERTKDNVRVDSLRLRKTSRLEM